MPFKLRNINKLAFNKQMALPLKFKSIKNRENYLVSKCNIEAVKLIENSTFWKNSKKLNVSKASLDLLKLLLSYCSQKSGLAEKLITDADELRLILDGQKEDLEVFRGWRNEIFGKYVHLLLEGKIAFTIKDNKIKKIEF